MLKMRIETLILKDYSNWEQLFGVKTKECSWHAVYNINPYPCSKKSQRLIAFPVSLNTPLTTVTAILGYFINPVLILMENTSNTVAILQRSSQQSQWHSYTPLFNSTLPPVLCRISYTIDTFQMLKLLWSYAWDLFYKIYLIRCTSYILKVSFVSTYTNVLCYAIFNLSKYRE